MLIDIGSSLINVEPSYVDSGLAILWPYPAQDFADHAVPDVVVDEAAVLRVARQTNFVLETDGLRKTFENVGEVSLETIVARPQGTVLLQHHVRRFLEGTIGLYCPPGGGTICRRVLDFRRRSIIVCKHTFRPGVVSILNKLSLK